MEKIKETRTRLRISQSKLSRLSGVSRFRIYLHERGDLALTDAEIVRIRDAAREEAKTVRHDLMELVDERR